jgi:hypothetical protein
MYISMTSTVCIARLIWAASNRQNKSVREKGRARTQIDCVESGCASGHRLEQADEHLGVRAKVDQRRREPVQTQKKNEFRNVQDNRDQQQNPGVDGREQVRKALTWLQQQILEGLLIGGQSGAQVHAQSQRNWEQRVAEQDQRSQNQHEQWIVAYWNHIHREQRKPGVVEGGQSVKRRPAHRGRDVIGEHHLPREGVAAKIGCHHHKGSKIQNRHVREDDPYQLAHRVVLQDAVLFERKRGII